MPVRSPARPALAVEDAVPAHRIATANVTVICIVMSCAPSACERGAHRDPAAKTALLVWRLRIQPRRSPSGWLLPARSQLMRNGLPSELY